MRRAAQPDRVPPRFCGLGQHTQLDLDVCIPYHPGGRRCMHSYTQVDLDVSIPYHPGGPRRCWVCSGSRTSRSSHAHGPRCSRGTPREREMERGVAPRGEREREGVAPRGARRRRRRCSSCPATGTTNRCSTRYATLSLSLSLTLSLTLTLTLSLTLSLTKQVLDEIRHPSRWADAAPGVLRGLARETCNASTWPVDEASGAPCRCRRGRAPRPRPRPQYRWRRAAPG